MHVYSPGTSVIPVEAATHEHIHGGKSKVKHPPAAVSCALDVTPSAVRHAVQVRGPATANWIRRTKRNRFEIFMIFKLSISKIFSVNYLSA